MQRIPAVPAPSGGLATSVLRSHGTPLSDVMRLNPHPSKTEVSDTEEERQRHIRLKRAALATLDQNELRVIVISSDEEDMLSVSVIAQKGSQPSHLIEDSVSVPGQHKEPFHTDSESRKFPPVTPKRKNPPSRATRTRQVVLSSDSEESDTELPKADNIVVPHTPSTRRKSPMTTSDDDTIDLTWSSPESERFDPALSLVAAARPGEPQGARDRVTDKAQRPTKEDTKKTTSLPLFLDDSESDSTNEVMVHDPFSVDGGAILVLNEPRSAQKPTLLRRGTPSSIIGTLTPSTPKGGHGATKAPPQASDSEDDSEVPAVKPAGKSRVAGTVVAGAKSAVSSPGPNKLTQSGKAPRLTKKALLQLELTRRKAYAQKVFEELNETIFNGGIPPSTELQWNKRLLTTAGRAHWRKTREGEHITSIQLAEKILDSDERIRNTLSHEMCHLACWIINEAPEENHGSLFKAWAHKIMRKRPEIEVTTRHSYEIKYKYEWKCADCAKVYGRHSKSINPDECVCGVCKVGQLVPQFESRRRVPRTPKPKVDSQNAAARSRDSPLAMPGAFLSPSPAENSAGPRPLSEMSNDGNSDVEILAHTLKTVHISGDARPA